jgi:hypothetical protein
MIRSALEAIRRLRRLLAELDYAQWRLPDIQTGLVLTPETEHAIARAQIDKLNALYEAEITGAAGSPGPGRDTTPTRSAIRRQRTGTPHVPRRTMLDRTVGRAGRKSPSPLSGAGSRCRSLAWEAGGKCEESESLPGWEVPRNRFLTAGASAQKAGAGVTLERA